MESTKAWSFNRSNFFIEVERTIMLTNIISPQDTKEISLTKQLMYGTRGETPDGRKYRYAAAGVTGLAIGLMNENSAIVAAHSDLVTAVAAPVGYTQITVTLGAAAVVKNYYTDGYLLVNDANGEGCVYLIKGHAAHAGSGNLVVDLAEPVTTAITTAGNVTLVANPYKGVIVVPSAATSGGVPVGVNNIAVTGLYSCWLQTGGACAMLSSTTPQTLGDDVSQEASGVAGSASPKVATCPSYGTALQLGVATEYQVVMLNID